MKEILFPNICLLEKTSREEFEDILNIRDSLFRELQSHIKKLENSLDADLRDLNGTKNFRFISSNDEQIAARVAICNGTISFTIFQDKNPDESEDRNSKPISIGSSTEETPRLNILNLFNDLFEMNINWDDIFRNMLVKEL